MGVKIKNWFITPSAAVMAAILALAIINVYSIPAAAQLPGFSIELASVSSSGQQGNSHSGVPSISDDGRFVAFTSDATNLDLKIPDTNGMNDVFVRDRLNHTTTRESISPSGTQCDGESSNASMNRKGGTIAFASSARNFGYWTNGIFNVYVKGIGITYNQPLYLDPRPVSLGFDGIANNFTAECSLNGPLCAYSSDASNIVYNDTNGVRDIFFQLGDWYNQTRVSVSSSGEQGNGASWAPSITDWLNYGGTGWCMVAFASNATNLVPNDTNGVSDIFYHDTLYNTTRRASVSSSLEQGNGASDEPSISSGGFIAFSSYATNLVPDDTNGVSDVFVRDANTTTRVSIGSFGQQAFASCYEPSISPDGRFVAFTSDATNLDLTHIDLNGVRDIFVSDTLNNTTLMVSVNSSGQEGVGQSNSPSISGISSDGQYIFIAFQSQASNLVPNDTNGTYDVFVATVPINSPWTYAPSPFYMSPLFIGSAVGLVAVVAAAIVLALRRPWKKVKPK